MWVYSIRTGIMEKGKVVHGTGYSGHGDARNDPDRCHEANVGPIPCGWWTIAALIDTPSNRYCLKLLPKPGTETFGRSGFLIHGDKAAAPGTASTGCIVVSRECRVRMWKSPDHDLLVVAGQPPEIA